MRLIDADKFKEDLLKLWDYNSVDGITATTVLKQVISDLDNATTVTDRTEEVLSLQNTIAKLVEGISENTRPKGEWKETGYETGALGITYRQTQCSNCGWEHEHAFPMWWNFCPNCGAEMKKG